MSSVRWGDSDSEDDNEEQDTVMSASMYARLHEQEQQPKQQKPQMQQQNKNVVEISGGDLADSPQSTPARVEAHAKRTNSSRSLLQAPNANTNANTNSLQKQNSLTNRSRTNQGGNKEQSLRRSKTTGSGGGEGGGLANPGSQRPNATASDWKQMAKKSSKFGTAAFSNQNDLIDSVDGSSWMALRRAKQQHEEEEQRELLEKKLLEEQEGKRLRRKSQMEALKVAVQTLEISQPPVPVSSLQAASALFGGSKHLPPPSSPVISSLSPSRKPIQILKRPEPPQLLSSSQPVSTLQHQTHEPSHADQETESIASASTQNSRQSKTSVATPNEHEPSSLERKMTTNHPSSASLPLQQRGHGRGGSGGRGIHSKARGGGRKHKAPAAAGRGENQLHQEGMSARDSSSRENGKSRGRHSASGGSGRSLRTDASKPGEDSDHSRNHEASGRTRGGGRHRDIGRGRHGRDSGGSTSESNEGGAETEAGKSASRDDQRRHAPTGRASGRDGSGRGRWGRSSLGARAGAAQTQGKIDPGKPELVRTLSGTVQYHLKADESEQRKTHGELLPNGTVRLSKKGHGSKHGNAIGRTSIQTRLEVGSEVPSEK